jgi:hypothetical protein
VAASQRGRKKNRERRKGEGVGDILVVGRMRPK